MMRRTIAGAVLAASLAFSAVSSAQASGYPMVSIVPSGDSTMLMVGSFSDASFSFQEADAYTAFVAAMIAGQSATTYTPSELAAMGYGDATALISMLYSAYQGMGFTAMMYFNVQRVACQGGSAYGVSDRFDIYVADLSTLSSGAIPGDYVASFEFPEGFMALASSL